MKLLCALFDVKAGSWSQPVCFESVGEARRSFYDLCSNKTTVIGMHPADFTLYQVGEYDTVSSTVPIVSIQAKEIVSGIEYQQFTQSQEKDNA